MVTAKLISAFVFATRIVQSLYYLNPKFQASSHLLWLYSPVCVGPGRNPEDRFSQNEARIIFLVSKSEILGIFFGCKVGFVSDLVRNPEDRFSPDETHIISAKYSMNSGWFIEFNWYHLKIYFYEITFDFFFYIYTCNINGNAFLTRH